MSRYIWAGLVVVGISLAGLNSMAAGQLKFATGVKGSANYYLPLMAAEEKGFWKENSLQVEWIPFRGGGSMFRSVAAGAVKIGFTGTPSVVQAAARGVSALAISELMTKVDFVVWVRADSAIRKPNDLKGAKIGVGRFEGLAEPSMPMAGWWPGRWVWRKILPSSPPEAYRLRWPG